VSKRGGGSWGRLKVWLRADRGAPDDGDAALAALCDVGRLRRLLDQAELIAVRTARRHGKSWAEIATQLGVTRQSAWEKWRELDDTQSGPPLPAERADVPAEVIERAARQARGRSDVRVPSVVGLEVDAARAALSERGLLAVGADPDDLSLTAVGAMGWVATDQSPESGAKRVTLWVERRDGGSGVREPRLPRPDPRVGRAMRDELTDEAVG
jgi:transposase-like protein